MKAAALLAVAVMAAPSASFAAFPYNGVAPISSDPATMAMARKAVGQACRFKDDAVGPQVAGFTNLKDVRQETLRDGFMFVRQHGAQRVAFLARTGEKSCRIRDVHQLPPRAPREAFLHCRIDNPDPMINEPLSQGLGLRQNGKRAPVAYLEVDLKTLTWSERAADDTRIKCDEFETID